MLGVRLQPRCDEPWTEVVYEDSSEGKLTVSASTRAAFTAVPVIRTCPTQTLPDLKCMWRPPPSAPCSYATMQQKFSLRMRWCARAPLQRCCLHAKLQLPS